MMTHTPTPSPQARFVAPTSIQPTHQDAERLRELMLLLGQNHPAGRCTLPMPQRAATVPGPLYTGLSQATTPAGLEKYSMLSALGTSFSQIVGPVHEIFIPSTDRSKAGTWATAADVDPGTEYCRMTPRAVHAEILVSRQIFKLSPAAAALLVEAQLHQALATALDAAALIGTGTDEPLGLLNDSAIASTAAPVTMSGIYDAEEDICMAYCETQKLGLIVAPDVRKALRSAFENGTGSKNCWSALEDFNRVTTPHAPAGVGIVGNFIDLVIAQWGGIEVLVNPYTHATEGFSSVTATGYFDVGILRPASFASIIPAN